MRGIEVDDIKALVWKAIADKQGGVPLWVLLNSTVGITSHSTNEFTCTIHLWKKQSWPDDWVWERQNNGSKTLFHIDPVSGRRMPVMIYDPRPDEYMIIFKAEVEEDVQRVTFTEETVLGDLVESDYELIFDDPRIVTSTMWEAVKLLVRESDPREAFHIE